MWIAPLLLEDHDVREVSFFGPLNNLLNSKVLPGIVLHIRNCNLELLHKVENVTFWPSLCCEQNLGRGLAIEILFKLVDVDLAHNVHVFVIVHHGFVVDTHRFNCLVFALGHLFFAKLFSEFSGLKLLQLCFFFGLHSPSDHDFLTFVLVFNLRSFSFIFLAFLWACFIFLLLQQLYSFLQLLNSLLLFPIFLLLRSERFGFFLV